ncbi:hypothetical protein ELG97_37160 [Rhizobium leguminosarum]|uniref:hypothetical protein n=1 Tax=Rhizobium leguminosarum TaxID=384 RepID=UPI0010326B88|nr:hypothetical protein [Rhizobium leguminosarum]TBE73861.1 hypothetical protein ELG97_37160 [Rhizobium leguminosarum]
MVETKTSALDVEKLLSALKEKTKEPPPREPTIMALLASDKFREVISELEGNGYTTPEIASFISKQEGVTQSETTIALYLRQIKREAKGDSHAKPGATKPKTAKTRTAEKPAAKPDETKSDKPGETSTAKPAESPATAESNSGGKSFTNPAFRDRKSL